MTNDELLNAVVVAKANVTSRLAAAESAYLAWRAAQLALQVADSALDLRWRELRDAVTPESEAELQREALRRARLR